MKTEQEMWREVAGFEGLYEVSDLGRVRSLPVLIDDGKRRPHYLGQSGRILKPVVQHWGHHKVSLYRERKGSTYFIHRLVCEAFHGPANDRWALHCDGNPANNRADNLRWGDAKDNTADSIRHSSFPKGERASRSKLSDEQVRELRRGLACGAYSVRAAAVHFGINPSSVMAIKHGRFRSEAGGLA